MPLGERGGTRVVDDADQEAVGVEGVGELVEGRDVRLLGPPVVEVVGLDVGHDRGVRRVVQERAVALVGLGDEQLAGARGRVDAGRGQVAADGVRRVRAGRLQRDREQRGRRRLAVGAGDGDHPTVGHHRGQRRRPGQHPQTLPLRLDVLGVVLTHRRRDDDGVDVARPGRRRGRGGRSRRARAAPASVGESLPSLPLTVMPRASMIRAIPESPAPPMPTKCTRPSRSTGQQLGGDRDLHGATPARRLEHHPGQLLVGVARDQRRGRGPHRGQPFGVGRERGDRARDPVGGQVGVGDQQPAAGVDDRAGVVLLLAVADRQRHEDRRQPDGRGLGHARGAGAAHDQVGGGVGEVHPVDEVDDDVRHGTRLRRGLALRTDDVQHLHPGGRQRGGGAGDRLVELAGALRAAGDQQRRPVGVEAEELPRLGAQRRAVEPGDHRADRQADVLRVRQRGVGEADRDPLRDPGAGLVGQAGYGVLLVHEQGQPAPPSGEVGRHRDVAAVADDDVGPDPVEDREGLLDGRAQPDRHLEEVGVGLARQRDRRDQLERVARLGHHPVLEAARRAEAGDLDLDPEVGSEPPDRVGGGEQGRGVAGGAAAGE